MTPDVKRIRPRTTGPRAGKLASTLPIPGAVRVVSRGCPWRLGGGRTEGRASKGAVLSGIGQSADSPGMRWWVLFPCCWQAAINMARDAWRRPMILESPGTFCPHFPGIVMKSRRQACQSLMAPCKAATTLIPGPGTAICATPPYAAYGTVISSKGTWRRGRFPAHPPLSGRSVQRVMAAPASKFHDDHVHTTSVSCRVAITIGASGGGTSGASIQLGVKARAKRVARRH